MEKIINDYNVKEQSKGEKQIKHRISVAEYIKKNQEEIIQLWEKKVIENTPEAENEISLGLKKSLDFFLNELTKNLIQQIPNADQIAELIKFQIRSDEPSKNNDYILPQLIKEFSALREVLNEKLFENKTHTYETHVFVDKVIDNAISSITSEFIKFKYTTINIALAKARESNKNLEQFATVTANNLKSPLATIMGHLMLLKDEIGEKINPQTYEDITQIHQTLVQMANLIDMFLEYSQLHAEEPFQPVRIDTIVEEAVNNLKNEIEKVQAEIRFEQPHPRVLVKCDRVLLTRFFQNLFLTSINNRSEKKLEIHVKVKEFDKENWIFVIKDNSKGYYSSDIKKILSSNQKTTSSIDQTESENNFVSCQKLIELHGGKIWVKSEKGKGARFFLTIPKVSSAR